MSEPQQDDLTADDRRAEPSSTRNALTEEDGLLPQPSQDPADLPAGTATESTATEEQP